VGHVGVVVDGEPLVVPTLIARDGDRVLLHGSVASGWMRAAGRGASIALEVTRVEGIIVARSGFHSSIRYRSCVLFGVASRLRAEPELAHALDLFVERILPGRVGEVRRPTRGELRQTMVLALPIERWSLKVSDGWPSDEEEDLASAVWAGVIGIGEAVGPVVDAPDLVEGVERPPSVTRLLGGLDT
jgi:nitroimidazol reductase NimA-like FMN-containing flavoprotein (pyridoxamine 5'-phosphate oxidase superfamily)